MKFLKVRNKKAVINGDVSISYSELVKNIRKLSFKVGEFKDKKAVIFMENRVEWLYSLYSVWISGGCAVPVDHLSSTPELSHIVSDSESTHIFVSNKTLKAAKEAVKELSNEIIIVNMDEITYESEDYYEKNEVFERNNEELALIIYTSGTTGKPKGVMLTFENLLANIEGVSVLVPIFKESDTTLMLLPVHHVLPLMGTIVIPLQTGGTIAVCNSMEGPEIMKTLQNCKVTIFVGVPRLWETIANGIMKQINSSFVAKTIYRLAKKINSPKFSKIVFKKVHDKLGGRIQTMVSGGSAINRETASVYKTLGFDLLEGYGMTEAAPMITFTRPGKLKLGSAGEAIFENTMKIEDGEILATGRNIMKGYYKNPEATAEVIKDGWLHTGDLGYIDKKGRLFITGRKKEMIVLPNGKNINPQEIEEKLSQMSPAISECAVFMKGTALHTIIVPEMKEILDLEIANIEEFFKWEIVDKYNKTAKHYMKVLDFTLINEPLPRTRIGKIKRFLLESFIEETISKVSEIPEPTTEEYTLVKEFLTSVTPKNVYPTSHIELDLGLDSLDRIGFLVFIRDTFGINMSENDLASKSTVLDVVDYIEKEKKKIEKKKIDWKAILNSGQKLALPRCGTTHIILKQISKFFLKLAFRIRVEGTENITEGPFIIAPNHQSAMDPLLVISAFDRKTLDNTYFFAKKKHFTQKWRQFMAERHNIIVMDIQRDLHDSLMKMGSVLTQGKNIIIFPEGTRTKDGKLGAFKNSFSLLSVNLGIPILPVAIKGADRALPKSSRFPRYFTKIRIRFLPLIKPEERSADELRELVYKRIRNNID